MRFQRVLLITPPIKTELAAIRPNIGLGYLAQILLENNICYDVLDMLLGYSLKNLKAKVDTFKPDLLGISLFSNKYKVSYELIENIKKYWPSMKIVVGGAHVSCLREKVLEECQAIDFGVVLEGEEALLELCREESLEKIKNLIYRQKDRKSVV
jgi:anaerobic magnesium-protoporphyrin IX monomethyl ester cyclase